MGMIKSFDIENLLPFRKRDGVANAGKPPEDKITDLDPTLNHEEQVYVGHYVGYADRMLETPERQLEPMEKRVVEVPAKKGPAVPAETQKRDHDEVA